MFAAHPELRNLFNQGNQANGEQRRALAGSVAAFAEHTPVAAMIDHLAGAEPGRRVLAVHADRGPRTHALRRQIADAGARMTDFWQLTWYEDPDGTEGGDVLPGRIDVTRLPLPRKARVFMCGPIPFMREIRRGLAEAGVSDERVHYEVFGPDLWTAGDRLSNGTGIVR
ncbi:ferredoxin-NADP reductase [Actinomadura luteofluorescens]|uniref:Ferredoxin-NADP reductase n=1 Tax=Actinomadura luteofluorescens TaxID=46163 RepID=A0A7Y9EBH3_9ACTN|nr:hypothetical protein [Actinomadura luteofluorescens]NYD44401.1 ferredoxin-NADP reductase [Actinomadura luteofluorescens]